MDAVVIKDFFWKYPNFTGIKTDYVLKGINLTIKEGEFLGITGRSGSGKTTLCFSISGLVPHQLRIPEHVEEHISGRVEVFGQLVSGVKKVGTRSVWLRSCQRLLAWSRTMDTRGRHSNLYSAFPRSHYNSYC